MQSEIAWLIAIFLIGQTLIVWRLIHAVLQQNAQLSRLLGDKHAVDLIKQ
jgi:hypothetical protein